MHGAANERKMKAKSNATNNTHPFSAFNLLNPRTLE